MLQIAGVRRKKLYSPNHIENDALIFLKTVERLKDFDFNIKIYEEQDLGTIEIKELFIFSMAQGVSATEELLELEDNGRIIINSPKSSINTYRVNMVRDLPAEGIPFPKSYVVPVDDIDGIKFEDFNARKIWVKRGDVHAVHREDVTLVYSEEEKENIFREFKKRGIEQIVLQEHLDGDVIKFYAVKGTNFFHWYYLNGINHNSFNQEGLSDLAFKSADVMGLHIFGGDAVISPNGSISIIDINDWPSFAPVRDKASEQIANLIFQKAKNYEHSLQLKF